jgi:hypothetical protein
MASGASSTEALINNSRIAAPKASCIHKEVCTDPFQRVSEHRSPDRAMFVDLLPIHVVLPSLIIANSFLSTQQILHGVVCENRRQQGEKEQGLVSQRDAFLFRINNLNLECIFYAMSIEEGADQIYSTLANALQRKEGALIGRNGTIELETLLFRLYESSPNQSYPASIAKRIELHAGIWPTTKSSLDKWVFQMVETIRLCDVLVAGWYEPLKEKELRLLQQVNTLAPRIPLRSLEPYYVTPEKRWTNLLAGQRVAVVSSFAETIQEQVDKSTAIWPTDTESLLPSNVEWVPIRTGYAPALAQGVAGWPAKISSWDVAVDFVVKRVVESQASIAIIGCGALGMCIGAELKRRGVIAIVLGGATQVLFGIKGQRWSHHSVISTFWNDAWVYPKDTETPLGASWIEGGCYWSKIEY